MGCSGCNKMTKVNIISTRQKSRPVTRAAGTGRITPVPHDTIAVSDQMLFRMARVHEINLMFPVMASVRDLEYTMSSKTCRSCKYQRSQVQIDRSPLDRAMKQLAECSDDKAKLVCQALGVAHYRIHYRDDHGSSRVVTR